MADIFTEDRLLNDNGTYDPVYKKTKAWLVERDDGRNVEDELTRVATEAAAVAAAKASAAEAAAKAASRPSTWMPTASDVGALKETHEAGNFIPVELAVADMDGAAILKIGKNIHFDFCGEKFLAELNPGNIFKAVLVTDGQSYVAETKFYHELYKPTPADIGAAVPSKVVSFTLSAAGWTGTAAPYTQTVTATGVTTSSNGTVGIADNATDAQWLAAGKAQIRKSAQAANSLTVKAYGEKPTVDIPCSVIVVG